MANRFVKNKTLKRIDLGDNDFVMIPEALSFDEATQFSDDGISHADKTKSLLVSSIKEWNLKDPDTNEIMPITKEAIGMLDISTTAIILREIMPMLNIPKAKLTELGLQ